MLTLHLIRHAKSDHPAGVDDRERPLNARGRNACLVLAKYLKTIELPKAIVCSDATRTTETVQRIYAALGEAPPVTFDPGLYLATPGELLAAIQAAGASSPLMIVAHNPGIEQLARMLVGSGEAQKCEQLRLSYPTAALTVLSFAISTWSEIAPASGRLVDFVIPKEK